MVTMVLFTATALIWLLTIAVAPQGEAQHAAFYDVALALTAISAASILQIIFGFIVSDANRPIAANERLRTALAVVFYAMAGLLWLRFALGVDVSNLALPSAALTVVLGLALQSTLGNLFSGLSLEMEQAIRVGDFIQKDKIEGRVEAIRWRAFFIKTGSNTQIILPNSTLTGQSVEIIRGHVPSRHMAVFTVAATVPPTEVLSITLHVLNSGLSDVCADPAPTAVVLGLEPGSGSLSYGARYYTYAYLNRTIITSNILVRLWYALARNGIAMAPGLTVQQRTVGEPATMPAPSYRAAGPDLPEDFAMQLGNLGRRHRYGPGEEIDLKGGAAIVLSGSAHEEVRIGEPETGAALAKLLAEPVTPGAPPIISERLLADISARAASFIGPITPMLAGHYGAHTDDPFLLFRALANHIPDEKDKTGFLSAAPKFPSRRLDPGALFGWTSVLGLEPPGKRHPVSNKSVEILLLTPDEARIVMSQSVEKAVAVLAGAEPGLCELTPEVLQQHLRVSSEASPVLA